MKDELDVALKRLRQDGKEESEQLFSSLLATYPDQRDHLYRKRSLVFAELELFDEAVQDRQAIIDCGQQTIGDLYFSGEYALQAGDFVAARRYFDQVIERASGGDPYYLGSSRLLAALASYQLHEDERCRAYLQPVEDDTEILWLKGFDRVTKQMMIEALNRDR
ncbi:hypothetical protein [Hydrogenophaga sp.]|uniref:hypothetical protein n=1 Tax=Hydrogenophaga sp. TaxID=1904254 RepID=UPI00261C8425|nr:hypothetical protein [Hydrogenophaga sp.]MDM7951057.1 hypothetical protein [Hydrogenophaga sp.]